MCTHSECHTFLVSNTSAWYWDNMLLFYMETINTVIVYHNYLKTQRHKQQDATLILSPHSAAEIIAPTDRNCKPNSTTFPDMSTSAKHGLRMHIRQLNLIKHWQNESTERHCYAITVLTICTLTNNRLARTEIYDAHSRIFSNRFKFFQGSRSFSRTFQVAFSKSLYGIATLCYDYA